MGVSDRNLAIINSIKQSDLSSYKALRDLLDMAKVIADEEGDNDIAYALKLSDFVKRKVPTLPVSVGMNDLYWESLKFEAQYRFESFLLYMERKRRPEKRFYQPRRKTLHIVAEDLQDLEDGKLDFYGLSMPPRVGKSTICIFFLAWVIGKRPASHNAMSGHSGILADRFYTDVLKLTTSEEYTFSEIFPQIKFPKTSSDKNELRYDEVESFATLTCRGIDGTWTGAVDISSDGYLYVDDMVRDRTESLSPKRLENRYQDYLNVLVDRKNDGSKELMVGTRWNVLDPLGRVETENKDNPRYRFRKIPALNENDESNFEYEYGKGFSTQYYRDMREKLDRNEWMAKYQQKPFVREGLLFPVDELNYYNGVLPDGDYLSAAACDVAWGGNDSLSMPFGYSFGSRVDGPIYIPDWIFNKGDKYKTKPLVTAKIIQNKSSMVRVEANNGGDEYAESVEVMLKEQGYKTNITWTKASNQISKIAKIIQYAPDVKRRCYFLSPELQSEEYKQAMEELTSFTQIGKNLHDDAPDGLVQLIQFISGELFLKMCKIGALKVKTVNPSMPADVNSVSSELDQQQTQTLKDDLYKNMLIIEGMPSREQNTGGDTGQAVYLRNGWDFAEQRAKIDEPVTKRSEREFLKVVLNILKTKQAISSDLTIADIDIKITRNKTDNMLVKSQALIYLLEKGIHPKIAIQTCDLWGDPEKTYSQSKPYLDALYKTAQEKQVELDAEHKRQMELSSASSKGGGDDG